MGKLWINIISNVDKRWETQTYPQHQIYQHTNCGFVENLVDFFNKKPTIVFPFIPKKTAVIHNTSVNIFFNNHLLE